ncbi:protein kinase domain-containing protein [Sarocladium implicatum]|nr:protein kinase domain-containing protein [Sarocladium implicatum]
MTSHGRHGHHGSHGGSQLANTRWGPYGGQAQAPVAAPGVVAPAGTFAPGTKIQVGSHRVIIQKYLSEGGFAHVYLVKMPKPVDGTDLAVLKRVAVPDKDSLRGMRTEVETMKRLKGHRPIVTYIDSHASEMKGGGYEVFLLMENCDGGGLIDFMNTRLQHRLTEPEILAIFTDIAEGLACMHYLKPPLLHRDIKVENVLITTRGSSKRFKLCDFGSAAAPQPAPTTVVECRLMDEDIQKHTTLQYRSPEMVDVYRKQPMDEKCDIWALGVLLYKLCYYTTPFEDQGQLAILNASYRFPSHPPFSDRLKHLIASMLKESMQARPNIYQVLKEACAMQNREVPIHDIYAGRSTSASKSPQKSTSQDEKRRSAAPAVGAVYSPPSEVKPDIPDVVPMRRGRPAASAAAPAAAAAAAAQRVTSGDPFAALDSKSARKTDEDEISSRFPSLDQFSLLHDSGSKFEFGSPVTSPVQKGDAKPQQLTEHLADEAFAPARKPSPHVATSIAPTARAHSAAPSSTGPTLRPTVSSEASLTRVPSAPSNSNSKSDVSLAQTIISSNPDLKAISSRNTSRYVSTGTMTSPIISSNPTPGTQLPTRVSSRVSTIQAQATPEVKRSADPSPSITRTSTMQSDLMKFDSSPRLSVDAGRPSAEAPATSARSNLPANRPRPVSTNLEGSSLDFLREREQSRPQSRTSPNPIWSPPPQPSPSRSPMPIGEPVKENSDLEYLRSYEEREAKNEVLGIKGNRQSVDNFSGAKPKLVGKFGDAFQRFENSSPQTTARTPSPLKELEADRRDLTPAREVDVEDGWSNGGAAGIEEDLSPEKRRELERQQLLDEEARVAKAQAEYRHRVATENSGTTGPGQPRTSQPVPRSSTIQNRVQSLLSDEARAAPVHRTAEGYGKYSDAAFAAGRTEKAAPSIPRKPVLAPKPRMDGPPQRKGSVPSVAASESTRSTPTGSSAAYAPKQGAPRPTAPKKPIHLNSLPTGGQSSPGKALRPVRPTQAEAEEQLIALDIPGQPALDMTQAEKDNYLDDFSKRFPSLSSIEMVERDIGGPGPNRS